MKKVICEDAGGNGNLSYCKYENDVSHARLYAAS